jgi:mannose/cellobiose epimerase-like protein (N-acyl-D-glucosamine 2-epimerase family)
VWNFVFAHMVNMEGGGEWYERVDREGNVVDSALGHGWKVNYHTVRSMIQVILRLQKIMAS